MTDRPEKRGGRREPPGGRPAKGNVRLACYVPPFILEEIDRRRGALTRGEFITMLVAGFAIGQSGDYLPNVAGNVAADENTDAPPRPNAE